MFGELLRELRKDHGMTQVDLAKELSLSPLTISAYERNRCVPDDNTKVKRLFVKCWGISPEKSKPYNHKKAELHKRFCFFF